MDCGLILRYVDANNYALCPLLITSANTIHVNKVISGSTTSIGTVFHITWGASTKHTIAIKKCMGDILQKSLLIMSSREVWVLNDAAINSATKTWDIYKCIWF
jgi:hypothetical protein